MHARTYNCSVYAINNTRRPGSDMVDRYSNFDGGRREAAVSAIATEYQRNHNMQQPANRSTPRGEKME
jgi:hypothetical protein